eukprot:5921430-Pleurochrysis_carterae.AAC.1
MSSHICNHADSVYINSDPEPGEQNSEPHVPIQMFTRTPLRIHTFARSRNRNPKLSHQLNKHAASEGAAGRLRRIACASRPRRGGSDRGREAKVKEEEEAEADATAKR